MFLNKVFNGFLMGFQWIFNGTLAPSICGSGPHSGDSLRGRKSRKSREKNPIFSKNPKFSSGPGEVPGVPVLVLLIVMVAVVCP